MTVKQEVIIVFTSIATILASCNEEDEKPVLPNDPADLSFTFTQDAEGQLHEWNDLNLVLSAVVILLFCLSEN